MKVLKKMVAIGAMACLCVAFGGTKVAEAATCTHEHVKQVGGMGYSEVVGAHDAISCEVDPDTGSITLDFGDVFTCYAVVYYNDVAVFCDDCGAVIDTWKEEVRYEHTHWRCPLSKNTPIRIRK